jgi:hypothetical protein
MSNQTLEQVSFTIPFTEKGYDHILDVIHIDKEKGIRDIYRCTINKVRTMDLVLDDNACWCDLEFGPSDEVQAIGNLIESKMM